MKTHGRAGISHDNKRILRTETVSTVSSIGICPKFSFVWNRNTRDNLAGEHRRRSLIANASEFSRTSSNVPSTPVSLFQRNGPTSDTGRIAKRRRCYRNSNDHSPGPIFAKNPIRFSTPVFHKYLRRSHASETIAIYAEPRGYRGTPSRCFRVARRTGNVLSGVTRVLVADIMYNAPGDNEWRTKKRILEKLEECFGSTRAFGRLKGIVIFIINFVLDADRLPRSFLTLESLVIEWRMLAEIDIQPTKNVFKVARFRAGKLLLSITRLIRNENLNNFTTILVLQSFHRGNLG